MGEGGGGEAKVPRDSEGPQRERGGVLKRLLLDYTFVHSIKIPIMCY